MLNQWINIHTMIPVYGQSLFQQVSSLFREHLITQS